MLTKTQNNMKKLILLLFVGILSTTAFGQPPQKPVCADAQFTSWKVNTTGAQASYYDLNCCPGTGDSTLVQLSDSSDIKSIWYTSSTVYITAEGLGSYVMGTWPLLANGNAAALTPSAQGFTYQIPRVPAEQTGTKTTVDPGMAGMAVNGVALYGRGSAESYQASSGTNSNGGDGIWNADAWVNEGENMDPSGGGHPQGSGQYHYHATPFTLYGAIGAGHSPIIGWALDGYPIYGPYGYDSPLDSNSTVTRIKTGYTKRNITVRTTLPDGSTASSAGPAVTSGGSFDIGIYNEDNEYTNAGHLDKYNGRTCITPEYPKGTYAYFITIDAAGEPEYPYIYGDEFYGVVSYTGTIGSSTVDGSATSFDSQSCGVVTGTGSFSGSSISVYPNPSSGTLNISGLDAGQTTIQVVGTKGDIVYSWTGITNGQKTIELPNLESQICVVTVTSNDKVYNNKVMISK